MRKNSLIPKDKPCQEKNQNHKMCLNNGKCFITKLTLRHLVGQKNQRI